MIRIVAFDTETWLIVPGMLTPKLVCGSFAEYENRPSFDPKFPNTLSEPATKLFAAKDALDYVEALLDDWNVVLVTHNGPYDFGVCVAERPSLLGKVFRAYEDGRIRDTLSREKLYRIAKGQHEFHRDPWPEEGQAGKVKKTEWSLQQLVWRWFGTLLAKTDTWRLRYSELDGLPVDQYPEDAARYSRLDAAWTLKVFTAQGSVIEWDEAELAGDAVPTIPNEVPQVQAMWVLHLMSIWGLRTSGSAVSKFQDKIEKTIAASEARLKESGVIREDGTRDMGQLKELIAAHCATLGIAPVLTPTGEISTAGEETSAILKLSGAMTAEGEKNPVHTCSEIETTLFAYADAAGARWQASAWLPILQNGAKVAVQPRYNHLVETGRTSCEKPNLHNPPRKGGVRECFEARPGTVYIGADYDTLELRTWAQACMIIVGWSEMQQAMIRGEDPHSALGADLLGGIPYEDMLRRLAEGDAEADNARQQSKPGNFGFPGGMAAKAFADYVAAYGIVMSLDRAKELHAAWKKKWPEHKPYFQHINSIIKNGGIVEQLFSGRVRGGATYTSASNGFFQGLAADGAKAALWAVMCECYLRGEDLLAVRPGAVLEDGQDYTALYGSRPIIFLHDEIIAETPEENAHRAAKRLQVVMIEEMKIFCPDVPIKASAVMTRNWWKGAKPVFDANKNMIPSKPETFIGADGRKKTKWVEDLQVPEGRLSPRAVGG